ARTRGPRSRCSRCPRWPWPPSASSAPGCRPAGGLAAGDAPLRHLPPAAHAGRRPPPHPRQPPTDRPLPSGPRARPARRGVLAGSRLASARAVGANDRIRVGVIGTGGRARGLMRQLKDLPGAQMVAVADVYEPRALEAAEIAGGAPARHLDYRRILDDKEI